MDDAAMRRLDRHISDWVLTIGGVVFQGFPEEERDEAMGLVVAAICEHMLAPGADGMIGNRLKFAEAVNERGRGNWVLRYVDPEPMSE
jgi:hypothetical protein